MEQHVNRVANLGKALCIVTGASKGFGRSLVLNLGVCVRDGSVFVVIARSGEQLQSLKHELLAARSEAGAKRLHVNCVPADLSTEEGLQQAVRAVNEAAALAAVEGEILEHLLLVNNAGSLGNISKFVVDFTSPAEVDSYFAFNVTAALCLTASILKAFPKRPDFRRTVVNVSSLCALKPFKSWSLYCTGKAARNMMFKALAVEEPDVRVLNYAPGPLETDMMVQARAKSGDSELRQELLRMHQSGKVLDCNTSSKKLVDVLLKDTFESGAHVDFYDL